MTVAAILKHKGNDVVSVAPGVDVIELARTLSARHIGAAVVQDTGAQLLGIVTERDLLHAIATKGVAALGMTVGQLMTRALTTVTPSTTVAEAMELMTAGRFRHLPVVEFDRPLGMVSVRDALADDLADLRAALEQQEDSLF